MNDNQIMAIIIRVIRAGLDAYGLTNVLIKQSFQPRQTGVEVDPTIYIHKISADRYGFPSRIDTYNRANNNFDHIESIWKTPTYQIDGLSAQDPSNIRQLTASDITEAAAEALQSEQGILTFKASRISIERITNIRELYFIDDRDRQEQRANFDFTISHRFERRLTVPPVSSHTLDIRRIC